MVVNGGWMRQRVNRAFSAGVPGFRSSRGAAPSWYDVDVAGVGCPTFGDASQLVHDSTSDCPNRCNTLGVAPGWYELRLWRCETASRAIADGGVDSADLRSGSLGRDGADIGACCQSGSDLAPWTSPKSAATRATPDFQHAVRVLRTLSKSRDWRGTRLQRCRTDAVTGVSKRMRRALRERIVSSAASGAPLSSANGAHVTQAWHDPRLSTADVRMRRGRTIRMTRNGRRREAQSICAVWFRAVGARTSAKGASHKSLGHRPRIPSSPQPALKARFTLFAHG